MTKEVKIKLYPFQAKIMEALKKFKVVTLAIGRRQGKSYSAGFFAIAHCLKKGNRRTLIIGPTSDIARESYWSQLKEFLQMYKPFVKQVKEREKDILFTNGSMISLKSADRPDSLRGISGTSKVSFCILDEFSFLRNAEEFYEEVIAPYRAADPNLRLLNISTPKGNGNFFAKMFNRGLDDNIPDHTSLQYTCYEAQPWNKHIWDEQKKSVTDKAFKQEYLAEFLGSGQDCYYAWNRDLHIDPSIKDVQNGENLTIAIDANAGIMANLICRVKPSDNDRWSIEVIKEVQGKHRNVEELITDYNQIYKTDMGCTIQATPDASMAQRSYAASIGQTGMSLLKNAGWRILCQKKNPSFVDSVQAVNNALYSATGQVDLRIHPSCTGLIEAIEGAQWSDTDGHKLAKGTYSKGAHVGDCIRYLCYEFRTRKSTISTFRNIQTF